MIDVNDFKQINDTYGHVEGDRALVIIADSLRAFSRDQSVPVFLCRYGGDEFIVILRITDRLRVETMIQELRDRLRQTCKENETPYLIGISVGIEEYSGKTDSLQQCIQRADDKLYQDKIKSKSNGEMTIFH